MGLKNKVEERQRYLNVWFIEESNKKTTKTTY